MEQNELRKKYIQIYNEIAEVSSFSDIVMAVLRDNDGKNHQTDLFPVASILDEKISSLQRNADYFMWELHERELI